MESTLRCYGCRDRRERSLMQRTVTKQGTLKWHCPKCFKRRADEHERLKQQSEPLLGGKFRVLKRVPCQAADYRLVVLS